MDVSKIEKDFEKRFTKKSQVAYFIGKPLIFFKSASKTLGCSLSVGAYALAGIRDDERIFIQFSDTDDFLSCNYQNLEYNSHEQLFSVLLKARNYGAQNYGMELLIHYMTKLSHPYTPVLLAVLEGVLQGKMNAFEAAKHFEDFEKNAICLLAKKDRMCLFDGTRMQYLPFLDDKVKIVAAYVGGKQAGTPVCTEELMKEAVNALSVCDYEQLGSLLNRQSSRFLKDRKGLGRIGNLFSIAVSQKDAYGSGILEEGGIFSVVKNSRVDAYMHNIETEYSKYFGGRPEFYITSTENSGVQIKTD